jgi:hypothetical protein
MFLTCGVEGQGSAQMKIAGRWPWRMHTRRGVLGTNVPVQGPYDRSHLHAFDVG